MIAYVFPGQGSQVKGMGKEIFEEYEGLIEKADKILGYSIKELCMENPDDKLNQSQYTQPALFVINALYYLKKIKNAENKADYLAGHSLGEYNALFAAGVLKFEDGLRLVKKRGELMSKIHNGRMAAVIGMDEKRVEEIINNCGLETIDIANLNTPSQIVISGPEKDIEAAKIIFEREKCKRYIQLNVSGAFHSRYMQEIKNEFNRFIESYEFKEINIPVISNFTARPYEYRDIKKLLTEQITNTVKWTETIKFLMQSGVNSFLEIGPGIVLSNLIKEIKKETETILGESDDKKNHECNGRKKYDQLKKITMESLGSNEYKKDYNLKYAYATGGMVHGIASKELVVKIGKAGMIGYFGTGGLKINEIEKAIIYIQENLNNNEAYGMNLLNNHMEDKVVELFLKYKIRNIEAAAYMQMTRALVTYRLKGLKRDKDGSLMIKNKIMAKLSRPEVAEKFFSPAPENIVNKLLEENVISHDQADISRIVPMADDICVESDSGGHTDKGVARVLIPTIINLRNNMMTKYNYEKKIRVGAAGGIGTPEAAAATFIMGVDFILTGSINQCTVEAGISDIVKDLLNDINVQDTDYAPAGDMFEAGSKVQVLKKGVFFPARANKLYELYRTHNSLDEIDEKMKKQLQEKYFKCGFDEIFNDCKDFYSQEEIEIAEKNPKKKMAMIFRWYFGRATKLALEGNENHRVDFQVQCGPALGSFNQWVKNTDIDNWRNRNVDKIAKMLLNETAKLLNDRYGKLVVNC